MNKFFLLAIFTIGLANINAQKSEAEFNCLIIDHKGKLREQFVDFKKLVLDLSFDTKASQVIGTANYSFTPLRTELKELFLDAPNIDIKSIELNSKSINFDYVDGGINLLFNENLDWEKEYSLQINYEANPKKGLYFISWNDETNRGRKQIWTQGQGIDNRHWIPGFDAVNDKLITETKVKFENGFEVISNGELISKFENDDNTTTWHHAMKKPHSLYLIMLGIGEYSHKDYTSKSGMISRQYYYTDKPGTVKPTYQYSNEMMDWFEAELGITYQWDIYKNVPVQDFMYGAMENTSATIFTDYYLQNEREDLERNYIGTNAHELAHNWFGDLITEWSGTHHWLHESFATHYAKRFKREVTSEDEYQWSKRGEQRSSLRAAKKNDLPVAHSGSGSSRHYPKGSFVIDMLRYVVGEEQYIKTVHEYLKEHQFDMVDTHDFQMAFMNSLGMNLDWFFNQWIYKGGEPEYNVSYSKNKKETIFEVEQVQEQNDLVGLFKMPIAFQVHYTDGSFDEKTEWIENKKDIVVIKNEDKKKIDYVLFDPNSFILKKVNFEKDYKELVAQAKKAKNMIDRYDAVAAMKDLDLKTKRKALIEIYNSESFRVIKQNILSQFEGDENGEVQAIYIKALKDKEVNVRRAALQNADLSLFEEVSAFEKLLEDESYVNIALTLNKLSAAYPDKTEEYLVLTEKVKDENMMLKLSWLNLASETKPELLNDIIDYSSESFEFRTRIKAISLLRKKEFYNEDYLKNLVNASISFNRRIKNTAISQLKDFVVDDEKKMAIEDYISNSSLSKEQKEMLDKRLELNIKGDK